MAPRTIPGVKRFLRLKAKKGLTVTLTFRPETRNAAVHID